MRLFCLIGHWIIITPLHSRWIVEFVRSGGHDIDAIGIAARGLSFCRKGRRQRGDDEDQRVQDVIYVLDPRQAAARSQSTVRSHGSARIKKAVVGLPVE